MPKLEIEFSEFSIKYSKEATVLRKNLPGALQRDLDEIIKGFVKYLREYPNRIRPISRDGRTIIYTHPQPPLEITFEIDTENKIIYFLHFAFIHFEAPRKRKEEGRKDA